MLTVKPGEPLGFDGYSAIVPADYPDWINLLKDEFADEHQLRNRVEIERGEILHRILSHIGNLAGEISSHLASPRRGEEKGEGEYVDSVIGAAMKAVQSEYLQGTGEWAEPEKKVRQLLGDPQFKPFFFLAEGEAVFPEREVVDSRGNTRRIDRLIVKQGRVEIIDYKSSGEGLSEHRKQLAEYIGIVEEIYLDWEIRGVLIYLDSLKMVEVKINNLSS